MATVDIAYREWLTRFKKANPKIADNPTVLEVIRITWDASKKAERAKHKEAATTQAHRDYLSGYSIQQATPAREWPARGGGRDHG